MKFTSAVKEDSRYRSLIKLSNRARTKIDDREIFKEMQNMLLARKYRAFDAGILDKSASKLADWAGELNSHRSRLADIRVLVLNEKLNLENMADKLRKHLTVTYNEALKKYTSVAARKAAVDAMLEEPLETAKTLDRIFKISEVVQKELEDSYYNSVLIKNIVEISTRADRA